MKKLSIQLSGLALLLGLTFTSCKKEATNTSASNDQEQTLKNEADGAISNKSDQAAHFEQEYGGLFKTDALKGKPNIVQVAQSLPIFKSLVAAVVKTDLVSVLSNKDLNATVFAPTDFAFAKLPAPFNNATNINNITDQATINALRNILLYHVLGTEVKKGDLPAGRSSAVTLKPQVVTDDNRIYLSNTFGLLLINGQSLVLLPNVDASNGIIHVIDDVLIPPTQNIAQIATGNPDFSALVAALVKTNLAGVFAGTGNFTVFAPTNKAFAELPAPFNNASNISNITSQSDINALANILKYHVTDSRYFSWDLGLFSRITTLASSPSNKIVGILGLDRAWVKGNSNKNYSTIKPSNILATNGVVQVIDHVLLP